MADLPNLLGKSTASRGISVAVFRKKQEFIWYNSQNLPANLSRFTSLVFNVLETQNTQSEKKFGLRNYLLQLFVVHKVFFFCAVNIVPRVSSPSIQGKASAQVMEVNDCFPECCVSPLTSCAVCKNVSCNRWLMFRWRTRMLVEHRYFEWFILFTVLISSLVLVRLTFFFQIPFPVWHCFRVVYESTLIEQ